MPVRQMTEEESERLFGSALVIFGMNRPTTSAIRKNEKELTGKVSGYSEVEIGQGCVRSGSVAADDKRQLSSS